MADPNETEQDVDQALAAFDVAHPVEGAQVAAPEVTAAPAVASPQEQIQKNLEARLLGGDPSAAAGGSSRLANAAPPWYTPLAPPRQSVGAGAAGLAGQVLAQGAQKRADLGAAQPLRTLRNKMADQNAATNAAFLGGLVNLLANKPQADYAQQQDAALKQAQMQKILSDGRNSGNDQSLGYLNYLQRQGVIDSRAKAAAQAAEVAARRADPNSQDSKHAVDQARAAGLNVPDGTSYDDVMKMRTAYMEDAQREFRGNESDRTAQNTEARRIEQLRREQLAQVRKEQRAEEKRMAENTIPGRAWANGPPDEETSRKARDVTYANQVIDQGAQRLAQIQDELEKSGVVSGALGKYKLVEGIQSPDVKNLLEEARQIQRGMSDAYRKRAEFGTLTGRDKELADEMNQAAGSPEGYFIGRAAWDALRKENAIQGENKLRSLGSVPEAEGKKSPSLAKPPEQQIQEFEAPAIQPYQHHGKAAAPSAPAAEKLPAGGGDYIGVFSLKNDKGMSSPRPLTKEQYDALPEDVRNRLVRMQ
jgi:hypothetical protein